jgi:hypothetical protein
MLLTPASLTAQMVLACLAAVGLTQDSVKPPSFSQQATAIWANIWIQNEPVGNIKVPSPDGTKTVMAVFDKVTDGVLLTVEVGSKRFKVNVEGGVGAELAWSPDSAAFFLTYSDGGLTGDYHTLVYYVSQSELWSVNLDLAVKRAFGHPVLCESSLSPNVVGVGWLEHSQRKLIAAQVIPVSMCDSSGTFKLYEVSLPGAVIVKPNGQLAAKKLFWSYLGADLRDARNICITHPKSCEVPYLHAQSN